MANIFKISKDKIRAESLLAMSEEREKRILPVLPRDLPYKLLEEYYEIMVQLITALMYNNGYKTLSHVYLIEYLKKNYNELNDQKIKTIDTLRKLRHGTMYYGKKVGEEFLINYEDDVKNIIETIKSILKEELG